MKTENLFEFYRGRIESCPNYGFKSGGEILAVIQRTAFWDSFLTEQEYHNIIILCDLARKKLLEDNYNAGWNE